MRTKHPLGPHHRIHVSRSTQHGPARRFLQTNMEQPSFRARQRQPTQLLRMHTNICPSTAINLSKHPRNLYSYMRRILPHRPCPICTLKLGGLFMCQNGPTVLVLHHHRRLHLRSNSSRANLPRSMARWRDQCLHRRPLSQH